MGSTDHKSPARLIGSHRRARGPHPRRRPPGAQWAAVRPTGGRALRVPCRRPLAALRAVALRYPGAAAPAASLRRDSISWARRRRAAGPAVRHRGAIASIYIFIVGADTGGESLHFREGLLSLPCASHYLCAGMWHGQIGLYVIRSRVPVRSEVSGICIRHSSRLHRAELCSLYCVCP